MHIIVLIKQVPDTTEIKIDPKTGTLIREGVESIINPDDRHALELAVTLKEDCGGKATVMSMGPTQAIDAISEALGMGMDEGVLLTDKNFAGADTLATTYTLSRAIRKLNQVDIIFCGEESSDGATGQVPPGIAEWLNISQLTVVSDINVDIPNRIVRGKREIKGGYEIIEAPLPVVISVRTASNEPRFMNYTIKSWAFEDGRITIWNKDDLQAEQEFIGEEGSPTSVSKLIQAPEKARKRIFLTGSTEEIVSRLSRIIKNGA